MGTVCVGQLEKHMINRKAGLSEWSVKGHRCDCYEVGVKVSWEEFRKPCVNVNESEMHAYLTVLIVLVGKAGLTPQVQICNYII